MTIPRQEKYGTIYPLGETLAFQLVVENPLGLHARPSLAIVGAAHKYDCEVTVYNQTKKRDANAKSILGVMALESQKGDVLRIEAMGSDARLCLEELLKATQSDLFNLG